MSPSASEPTYAVLPMVAMPSGRKLSGSGKTVRSACPATLAGANGKARAAVRSPPMRRFREWLISSR